MCRGSWSLHAHICPQGNRSERATRRRDPGHRGPAGQAGRHRRGAIRHRRRRLLPRRRLREGGRRGAQRPRGGARRSGHRAARPQAAGRGGGAAQAGRRAHQLPGSVQRDRAGRRPRTARRQRPQHGAGAALHPGAEAGRAQFAAQHRRLRHGADGSRPAQAHPADDGHPVRDPATGARVRDRRRRGRPAGDRHRQASRRARRGIRHPPRRRRAGGVARCPLRQGGPRRDRPDLPGLRQGAHARAARQAARRRWPTAARSPTS